MSVDCRPILTDSTLLDSRWRKNLQKEHHVVAMVRLESSWSTWKRVNRLDIRRRHGEYRVEGPSAHRSRSREDLGEQRKDSGKSHFPREFYIPPIRLNGKNTGKAGLAERDLPIGRKRQTHQKIGTRRIRIWHRQTWDFGCMDRCGPIWRLRGDSRR